MNLSCCDTTFPALTHEQALEVVAVLGFRAVDIAIWGALSHTSAAEVSADPTGVAARLRARTSERGLRVADVFAIADADYAVLAVNHPNPDERARSREWFVRVLELAAAVGAPGLTLIPGVEFDGEPHERSLTRAAEELGERVRLSHDAGLRLSVEPHIGSVIASPLDTLALLEQTPGLEITLDYSHFVMQGFDPAELDPLLGRVRHAHARGAKLDRLQVGWAENVIDFDRMVDRLAAVGFDGDIATEYLCIDAARCNECDTLTETVRMRDRLSARLAARSGRALEPVPATT